MNIKMPQWWYGDYVNNYGDKSAITNNDDNDDNNSAVMMTENRIVMMVNGWNK